MASDWIKARDSAFQIQAQELIAFIANYQNVWGLTPEDVAPLQECRERFETALSEQTQQATVYHAVVAEKQARREQLERALRSMVRRINNHPGMTQALREEMKLASPTRTSVREEACDVPCEEKGTDDE